MAGKVETRLSAGSAECASVVHKVGGKVTSTKPGDGVLVTAPGHFQTVERFPEYACLLLHDEERFEEMATLSIVYATALYGLCHRANIKEGEGS
jgi:NADPH:quinone reductase-like Zn-dependent oxidoreductase